MQLKSIVPILVVGMVLLLGGCKSANKTTTLKLAHGLDPTHPVHNAMVYMAEKLEEESGGKMKLEIYPSGQLGGEQQCVELLQIGSLAITKVSAAVMESFTPNYQVLGLPYIWRSREHSFKVLDGEIGQEFLKSTEKYNIKGLCFYDAGFRSYYTIDKAINSPEDLKGMKIRVMKSQTAMNMVKAMGGSPTPISWGELYTALQSGVVDGAENNPPSLYTSRHYEVCKKYTLNEHTAVPDIMIISTVIWDKLTEQEQKWLQAAADASVAKERVLWAEAEELALTEVQKAGVEIIRPDKAPFMKTAEPIFEGYKSQPKIYDLIQRIRNVQ
ncbi:TRAP transporter substrate-binding protein [Labilibacter marinus]|uniref:TRAP transporter substrate-binding protein n=1 Tax=Labilibacter marinus TaxID=1477105 RepID=UPI000830382C|nr:TRAP transporter substrate-binding protein [Labilibacter marinus]